MKVRHKVIYVLTIIIVASHSCVLNEEGAGPQGLGKNDTAHAASNSAQMQNIPSGPIASDHPEPFTTDRYFEFMFADQDLRWEEMEGRKEVEAKYRGLRDTQSLGQKQQAITALQLETGKKRKALFAQYGTTPDNFAASTNA